MTKPLFLLILAALGLHADDMPPTTMNTSMPLASEQSDSELPPGAQRVCFPNKGVSLVGHLYLPPHFDEQASYPALIVGHPAGGVKEQTAGLYARKLAERGFVTLAFDAAYQGESSGEPRGLDDPAIRTEDFRCAADYLSTLPYVGKMGVMGICGGGGFAIAAAVTDQRFAAVAGVSAVDLGQLRRDGMGGSLKASIRQRLAAVAEQRNIEAAGGAIRYNQYVPNSPDEIPAGAPPMYREGYEYYRTTGTPSGHAHPRSTNRYTFTSLDKLIAFTAFERLELLAPRPLLMIAGSRADSLFYSEDAVQRAGNNAQLHLIDGASHIQLYWKPEYVEEVCRILVDYFHKHLH